MNLFSKKFTCEQCKTKFTEYDQLIYHARHEHHQVIVKCDKCGKEFIHESERLHHFREEHESDLKHRVHETEHKHDSKNPSVQDEVDDHTKHFSDNF